MRTGYWPEGAPRAVTLDAFVAAYGTLGYVRCADGNLEAGFEKVVVYCRSGKPTHAARQLPTGEWTSKLGKDLDISHDTPEEVCTYHARCMEYGSPTQFLKRPIRDHA
jgi:hypothetical protein